MNGIQSAMAFLLSAVDGMRSRNTDKPVTKVKGDRKVATKKGATHVVNPPAKSKKGDQTPAKYRSLHMGARKKAHSDEKTT